MGKWQFHKKASGHGTGCVSQHYHTIIKKPYEVVCCQGLSSNYFTLSSTGKALAGEEYCVQY